MDTYPSALAALIKHFQKLPGVGRRSAERFAFHMIDSKSQELHSFSDALLKTLSDLKRCSLCGALSEKEICSICNDNSRDKNKICIVAHYKEIYSIEESGEWKGLYHVLGGVLSPLEGMGPEALNTEALLNRLEGIDEIVIALDSTLEGDTTSLYLKELLTESSIAVSRLAFGMPMGSSLEHVDGGTLAKAFSGRKNF